MYFEYADYLRSSEQYRPMFKQMEEEINFFLKNFKDDSRFLSGWGHTYFCPDDGGRLNYNIETPNAHECGICKKVYRGFMYDSAFITFLRNEAIVSLIKAGVLFQVNQDKKYVAVIKDIVNFYAEHYDRFAVHSKTVIVDNPTLDVGGAGKIMPQGLNEAIVIIRIINALEIIKDELEESWLAVIKEKLFNKAYELLLPQKMHIHNIPCWINSAIGVMGFFYNDKKWIDEAGTNPFNINEQIARGVTESGFWYEGSIHYNFFALEGIMNYFVFAKSYQYETSEKSENIIFNMLDAAYQYAFDNDVFPNPSDGWPNIGLKTYSYVYYMAYKVFGEKVLRYIQHIEGNKNPRPIIPLSEPYYYQNKIPLERLLFLPGLDEHKRQELNKRTGKSFEESNCAVLRNENINLFFKYGHQTRSHAHPDKMNVEIMVKNKVLTKDLSNSGYASKLCNIWHRAQAAHNTCMVNSAISNIDEPGRLLAFTNNAVEAECNAYEDTIYKRRIEISENEISDVFHVACQKESTIDYFFHFEYTLDLSNHKLTKTKDISEYEAIIDVYEIENAGEMMLSNELGHMKLKIEKGARLYFAKTFNNPANTLRDTIIIRKFDKAACFAYQFVIQ